MTSAIPPGVADGAGERRSLVTAAHTVMRRRGTSALTVADVLAEAGLSTRAFYRHFSSKDELVLAVFRTETDRSLARLVDAVDEAGTSRRALEAWIDEVLSLGFDNRRARRTRTFWREGASLRSQFPADFDLILAAVLEPLERVLRRGLADGTFPAARPEPDARSIHAVVWSLVEDRLDGRPTSASQARAHAIRFCLGALGARA